MKIYNCLLIHLTFLLIFNLRVLRLTQAYFPPQQLQALEALYNSTEGEHWQWKRPYSNYGVPWDFSKSSADPCTDVWQGIICSSSNCTSNINSCNIIEISLTGYGLNGSIPSKFCSIQTLQSLTLDYNNLDGTIPIEISQLSMISYLSIANNKLTGPIPVHIGNLTRLEYLILNLNHLSSNIPRELGNLTNLENLYLSSNRLTGTIPAELSQLNSVQEIHVDNNLISGILPPELGDITNLIVLTLNFNRLTGSIPSQLGDLSLMNILYLNENFITGTIPMELGRISNLEYLFLYGNFLSGTIPVELGSLYNLIDLYLSNNKLSGTIPAELGQLPLLEYLYLDVNNLNGTIPKEIGQLSLLAYLSLSFNSFHGRIPPEVCNLPLLQQLLLDYNRLTGTIPSEIVKLVSLVNLYLNSNHLGGTIPSGIGDLTQLKYLFLDVNALNGTIPSELGKLSLLNYLYLDKNQLVGTIPKTFANLSSLQQLHLSFNYLTGSIFMISTLAALYELSVGNNLLSGNLSFLTTASFHNLSSLNLYHNQFTGVLPSLNQASNLVELQVQSNRLTGPLTLNLSRIVYLDAASNKFTGPIPWSNLPRSLQYVNLSHNKFTSHLPSEMDLPALSSLEVSYNNIKGSIGGLFSTLDNLLSLDLSFNSLTGNVNHLTNSSEQKLLKSIDISYNIITGLLPSDLFRIQSLHSFIATGNCLTGDIPDAICDAYNMTTLVLDGMGASPNCNKPLYPHSHVYFPKYNLEESGSMLPSCIFSNLQKLETLHLSGLGLHGTLPATLPSKLQYLSLSNNQLSGTIPDSYFFANRLQEFDLSFNQLSGRLPDFSAYNISATKTQLLLQINRISGHVPSPLIQFQNINILRGNLFGCSTERLVDNKNLPPNDPNVKSYQCGSNESNTILYIWLICLVLIAVTVAVLQKLWRQVSVVSIIAYELPDFAKFPGVPLSGFRSLWRCSDFWVKQCILIVIFSLVVLVPVYSALTVYYHTYIDQYAWTISACFLTGVTSSIVLLIVFECVLGLYFRVFLEMRVVLKKRKKDNNEGDKKSVISADHMTERELWVRRLTFTGIVLCSAFLVIVINGAYVYSLQEKVSQVYLDLNTIALSLVKIYSNHILLKSSLVSTETSTYVLIALLCFNNVVVPYLAEAFVSPDCFYYATLSSTPEVTSTVYAEQYRLFINPDELHLESVLSDNGLTYLTFAIPTQLQITYQPPFIYSYACSSSIITNFASVFLIRYLLSGLIIPVIRILIDQVLKYLVAKQLKHWLLYRYLQRFQASRWKFLRKLSQANGDESEIQNILANVISVRIFDHRQFVALLVADIVVLLTFGILFPPLSVVILLSIFVHIADHRIVLREIIKRSQSSQFWIKLVLELDADLKRSEKLLFQPVPWVTFLIAAVWSFTLFDTLGSAVGAVKAASIVVAMCMSPFLWYGLYKLWRFIRYKRQKSLGGNMKNEGDFEISDMSTIHTIMSMEDTAEKGEEESVESNILKKKLLSNSLRKSA